MQQPAIISFANELAHACESGERSVEELLDVLRWRACLRYGFPTRNPHPDGKATLWTINGVYFGATPTAVVDAVLRTQLKSENAVGKVPGDSTTQLRVSGNSTLGTRCVRSIAASLSRLFTSIRSPNKEAV